MGITHSDLKNTSAFSTVGSFIVSKSSLDYIFSNNNEERRNAIKYMILGAILIEMPNLINNFLTIKSINN